jgi:hypothetical protein
MMSNNQPRPEADGNPQDRKHPPAKARPAADPAKEPSAIAAFEEEGAGIAAKE